MKRHAQRRRPVRELTQWGRLLALLAVLAAPDASTAAAFSLIHCPPGSVQNGCPVPSQPFGTSAHRPPPLWYGDHFHSLGFLLVAVALVAAGEFRRVRPGGRARRAREGSAGRPRPVGPFGGRATRWLLAAALLGGTSTALASAAFSHPTTRTTVVPLPYSQYGSFGYSAAAPQGVYDGDHAPTGQPVFLKLSPRVDFTFSYQFQSSAAAELNGTGRLSAVVGDGTGWRRTLELRPQVTFRGSATSLTGSLDLNEVQSLVRQFESQTGLHPAGYTVTIAPEIHLSGTLGGQYLEERFTPRLDFALDNTALRLADHSVGVDPLAPRTDGELETIRPSQAHLGLGPLRVPTAALRSLAVLGLLAGLLLAGLVGRATLQLQQESEIQRFHTRFRRRLLPIRHDGRGQDELVVEVQVLDDLGRLAEQFDLPILVGSGSPRYYSVRHDGLRYRYRALPSVDCSDGDRGRELFS